MIAFACDYDGTLLIKGRISQENIQAVKDFQRQGNLFGVCTGRSLKGILLTCPDIAFDFYILAGGALVYDSDFHVIFKETLPKTLVEEIYNRYGSRYETVIQANDTVYSLTRPHPLQTLVTSIAEIPGDLYGLSMAAGKDAIAVSEVLNEEFPDIQAYANVTNIDITSRKAGKGIALKALKEHFENIKTAGMGDSFNDVPLLQECDFPFSFDEKLYDRAVVVNSVAEAIAVLLKKYHL